MANIWIPAESDFALALREPNLVDPGRKPAGIVRLKALPELVNARLVIPAFTNRYENLAPFVTPNPTFANTTSIFTPQGHAIRFSETSSRINWSSGDYLWLHEQTFTQWIRVRWFDTPVNDEMIWNIGLRADIRIGPTGNLEYKYYDGSFWILSAGATPSSGESILHVVRRQGVGTRVFLDGSLVASNTRTQNFVYEGARDAGIGYRTTVATINSAAFDLLDAGYIASAWSDEQVEKHAKNPTYIYESANDTPHLYVVSTGGGVSIACGTGSLTLTGTNATIQQFQTVEISCGVGSITVTGSNATIQQGSNVEVACTIGSLTLTGVNASVAQTSNIVLATGSLSLTGANAQIEVNRNVTAAVGSLTLTGVNAVIDQQVAGQTNIVCTTGSITVTGTAAVINQVSNLSLGTGSIDVTGINASISSQRSVSLSTGSISLSGVNATIQGATAIACSAGAITITGFDITLGGSSVSIWTEIAPVSTTWTEI